MKFNEDLDLGGYSISGISEAKNDDGKNFLTTADLDESLLEDAGDIDLDSYYTKDEVEDKLSDGDFNSKTITSLETPVKMQVNLESTSSIYFDGYVESEDVIISPGIIEDGILPIKKGGTGNTSGLPVSHASSSGTYGVGSGTNYGHLKLSDSIDLEYDETDGYAATPNAISNLSDSLNEIILNKQLYDQVIQTQSEFETLIASSTWLDAKSVAFVGGTSTFTLSDGSGVFVPDTVIRVDGFNNATIEVTKFVYNSSTNLGGFWRNIITDDTFTCSGLTVNCSGTSSNYCGFYSCDNLTNCSGTGSIGFCICDNLTNCTGTGNSYGFQSCDNLTNCTGTNAGSSWSPGFYGCDNLINCTSTSIFSGFENCDNLTNCSGAGEYCFGLCDNLTNCSGTGTTYGFYICVYLTNCTGYGGGDTTGYGFYNCKRIANCYDGYYDSNIRVTSTTYGFYNCSYMVNCEGYANNASTSNSINTRDPIISK